MARDNPATVMGELGSVILNEETGWHFRIGKYDDLISALPWETVRDWLKEHGVEAARRIARHLALPHLDEQQNPVVPALTEFVLRAYEDDEEVFANFCAGAHSFQLYAGDIAAQHEREAGVARHFTGHRLRRIRAWAEREIKLNLQSAKEWRERQEEGRLW